MLHSALLLSITVMIVMSLARLLHLTLIARLTISVIGNQISHCVILGDDLLKLLDLRL